MKTSTASLSIWFAQVLTLCALHEDLLTTQEMEFSTTTSQVVDLAATGAISTERFPDTTPPLSSTLEIRGYTRMEEDVRRIVTPHHDVTRLIDEMDTSKNITSVKVKFQETGTGTESTSMNILKTMEILTPVAHVLVEHHLQTETSTSQEISTPRTLIQLDHDLQTKTSSSQEISTPGAYIQQDHDLQITTSTSQGISTQGTSVLLDHDLKTTIYMTQEISTPGTSIQLYHDLRTETSTSQEISTPGTSIQLDHDLKTETSTSQEISTPGTSIQLYHDLRTETSTSQEISTPGTSIQLDHDLRTETSTSQEISTPGTSIQLDHDLQTTISTNQTENRTIYDDEVNITTVVPLIYSTHETITSRNSGTTLLQSSDPTPTAGTHQEIPSTTRTPPEDTTNTVTPTEHTSRPSTITSASVLTSLVPSGSTENTEEPLASSTKMMDRETVENTKALETTQGSTTNSTWRDGAWFIKTEGTNTTNPENISMSGTMKPDWTTCFTRDSSQHPRGFSNRFCFITMWALAMVTSMFLGLSVFLWVRLSVMKRRVRLGGGRRERQGQAVAVKEKQNLWVEPASTTEDRVEFWYSDRATADEDKKRYRAGHVKTRKNGEREAGMEEEMWIQPKVTLKDITDFWHGNGRVRRNEETRIQLNED